MNIQKITSDHELELLVGVAEFSFSELYYIIDGNLRLVTGHTCTDEATSINHFKQNVIYYELSPESITGAVYCFLIDDSVYAVNILSGEINFESQLYNLMRTGMSLLDAISVISL